MTLHVTTSGDAAAPTIVFLHGLGVSSWMWTDQVASLEGRFRCVTIDLPGSGRSHAEPWVSLAATADAVAEVIEGAAHVVGLSLGGYVTLELLARHPEVVDAAVVSGVTARPFSPLWLYRALTTTSVTLMRMPSIARLAASAMRMPADARAAFVADAARLTPDLASRVHAEVLTYRLPELGPAAGRLLAVAGDHELAAVRRDLPAFVDTGASAAVAPHAQHTWNAQHPELFTGMVEAWVRDRTLPDGLTPVGAVSGRR